jgi:hypothetical protein
MSTRGKPLINALRKDKRAYVLVDQRQRAVTMTDPHCREIDEIIHSSNGASSENWLFFFFTVTIDAGEGRDGCFAYQLTPNQSQA